MELNEISFIILDYVAQFLPTVNNDRIWMAHFGVPVQAMIVIWYFLDVPCVQIKHLLWAFYYLKVYPTDDVGASFWKISCKTYENWVWDVLKNLYKHLKTVCIFNFFFF